MLANGLSQPLNFTSKIVDFAHNAYKGRRRPKVKINLLAVPPSSTSFQPKRGGSMSTKPTVDTDAAQLAALGYTSNFERTMSFWENFALGFTYLSPVVGVYSVFAMALHAGGPPMFWNYFLV